MIIIINNNNNDYYSGEAGNQTSTGSPSTNIGRQKKETEAIEGKGKEVCPSRSRRRTSPPPETTATNSGSLSLIAPRHHLPEAISIVISSSRPLTVTATITDHRQKSPRRCTPSSQTTVNAKLTTPVAFTTVAISCHELTVDVNNKDSPVTLFSSVV